MVARSRGVVVILESRFRHYDSGMRPLALRAYANARCPQTRNALRQAYARKSYKKEQATFYHELRRRVTRLPRLATSQRQHEKVLAVECKRVLTIW